MKTISEFLIFALLVTLAKTATPNNQQQFRQRTPQAATPYPPAGAPPGPGLTYPLRVVPLPNDGESARTSSELSSDPEKSEKNSFYFIAPVSSGNTKGAFPNPSTRSQINVDRFQGAKGQPASLSNDPAQRFGALTVNFQPGPNRQLSSQDPQLGRIPTIQIKKPVISTVYDPEDPDFINVQSDFEIEPERNYGAPNNDRYKSQQPPKIERGEYFVAFPDGRLHRVRYVSREDVDAMQYFAKVRAENVEPLQGPIYAYTPLQLLGVVPASLESGAGNRNAGSLDSKFGANEADRSQFKELNSDESIRPVIPLRNEDLRSSSSDTVSLQEQPAEEKSNQKYVLGFQKF